MTSIKHPLIIPICSSDFFFELTEVTKPETFNNSQVVALSFSVLVLLCNLFLLPTRPGKKTL